MKILDENKELNILECTPVLQGEGKSIGTPMILIRTNGCNILCQFGLNSICDAWETSWNSGDKKDKKWSLSEIREVIKKNSHIKHVMLTGGEPLLSSNLFKSIVRVCREEGLLVEVETNGSIFLEDLDDEINLVSISPKLKDSTPIPGTFIKELGREIQEKDRVLHLKNYRNIDSLKKWINNYDYQLKYVISSEEQIIEALELTKEIGASIRNVYFMPEGLTREQLENKRQWLYERCLSLGVKYTDRLHILVYDNLKGV